MKVQCQLQGKFHRLKLSGTDSIPVSLVDLIREVQVVAIQNHKLTPQLLRQSFGFDFLPKSVLITLLQQVQGVVRESEYQLPSLQLLQGIGSSLTPQVPNTYRYQFTCPEATFNLTPDNPQIPIWTGSDSEQPGIYTITLDSPNHPDLSANFAHDTWQQAIEQWQTLPENQKIYIALQSLEPTLFRLPTPQKTQLQVWIDSQDLSLDLRSAITFLRLGEGDTSALSEIAKSLVHQYQLSNNVVVNSFILPAQLSANQISPNQEVVIGRRNSRSILNKIISEARQFLLISSYIIEDEDLTELICKTAKNLPQGVWVLTDLRNEVVDRLDVQVSNNLSLRQEYQRSDQRKKACLRMLLDANIPIRSGAFHLKTYISEQSAYLGSCNLTGGSLDFNLEAGVVSQNNSTHTQLINLFRQFWQQRSRDEVIPISNWDGFRLRSRNHSPQEKCESYPNLLTPSRYKRDLIEQLIHFRGQVQIYSRSFQPGSEIEQFLRLLDTRVFIDSQVTPKHSMLNVKTIDNLHAKVTLLGDQFAYIGGVNFNFGNSPLSMTDLMYKTTFAREITQIRQTITSRYS